MKFGVLCRELSQLDFIKRLDFDYIEIRLDKVAAMSDDELEVMLSAFEQQGIRAESFNCFCPSDINLSCNVDEELIRSYTKRALSKAQRLGGKVIVLGSGRSRNVPEGYDFSAAREQFKRTVSIVADIAAEHGIKVAIEPLNRNETNLINTLADAEELCDELGHPNLGFLADLFHMYKNGEDVSEVTKHGRYIIHAHIARRNDSRGAPSVSDGAEDLKDFHDALEKIGYNGRITLESSSKFDAETSIKQFAELADHLGIRS